MSKQQTRCPNCNDGYINIILGKVTNKGFTMQFKKCDKCEYILNKSEVDAYLENTTSKKLNK